MSQYCLLAEYALKNLGRDIFLVSASSGQIIPSMSLPRRDHKQHVAGADMEMAHMHSSTGKRMPMLSSEVVSTINRNKLKVIRKMSKDSKQSDSGFESSEISGRPTTNLFREETSFRGTPEKSTMFGRRKAVALTSPNTTIPGFIDTQVDAIPPNSITTKPKHRRRKGRGRRLSIQEKGKKIIDKLKNLSVHTATLDEEAYAADSSEESDMDPKPTYRQKPLDAPIVESRPTSTLHTVPERSSDGDMSTEGDTYIDPSTIVSIPQTSYRMQELKVHNQDKEDHAIGGSEPDQSVLKPASGAGSIPSTTLPEEDEAMASLVIDDMTLHELNVPLDSNEIYDISNNALNSQPNITTRDEITFSSGNRKLKNIVVAVASLHHKPDYDVSMTTGNSCLKGAMNGDDDEDVYDQMAMGSLEGDADDFVAEETDSDLNSELGVSNEPSQTSVSKGSDIYPIPMSDNIRTTTAPENMHNTKINGDTSNDTAEGNASSIAGHQDFSDHDDSDITSKDSKGSHLYLTLLDSPQLSASGKVFHLLYIMYI